MLRSGGASVLTTQEAGNCGKDDGFQIAFAARTGRAIVTRNRKHFLNDRLIPPETTPGVLAIDVIGRSEIAELELLRSSQSSSSPTGSCTST